MSITITIAELESIVAEAIEDKKDELIMDIVNALKRTAKGKKKVPAKGKKKVLAKGKKTSKKISPGSIKWSLDKSPSSATVKELKKFINENDLEDTLPEEGTGANGNLKKTDYVDFVMEVTRYVEEKKSKGKKAPPSKAAKGKKKVPTKGKKKIPTKGKKKIPVKGKKKAIKLTYDDRGLMVDDDGFVYDAETKSVFAKKNKKGDKVVKLLVKDANALGDQKVKLWHVDVKKRDVNKMANAKEIEKIIKQQGTDDSELSESDDSESTTEVDTSESETDEDTEDSETGEDTESDSDTESSDDDE